MEPDTSSKVRTRPVLYANEYFDQINWRIDWKKVSIIIPAYNESERVVSVIKTAKQVNPAEVICVDNNSSDDTSAHAKSAGAKVIVCEKQGKAHAMRMGTAESLVSTSIILFLDADLTGLTKNHLTALVAPFFKKKDLKHLMTLGLFDRGASNKAMWQLPYLTGQRALYKADFLDAVKDIKVAGWEIEATLNAYFKTKKHPILPMVLDGLFHVQKTEKLGKKEGRKARAKMLLIAFMGSVKYPFRLVLRTLKALFNLR